MLYNDQETYVVRPIMFDFKLSDMLGEDLQRLGCRVNYHAHKFTNSIQRRLYIYIANTPLVSFSSSVIALDFIVSDFFFGRT